MIRERKVVIFDLDGTLIDSNGVSNDLDIKLVHLFDKNKSPEEIIEERDNLFKNNKNGDIYLNYSEYLKEKYKSNLSKEEILQIRRDYSKELSKNIKLKPDVDVVIKYLKNNNIKLALATVSRRETINIYVNENEYIKNKYGTIDILVNNAGFGACGYFTETNLEKELGMIDTNIVALHILTKLFLQDMVEENKGKILNVASIAGFMPGPLMATYYSSKAYVVRLTQSIRHELFRKKSKVKICALCPGPVATNFNKVADVKFNLHEADSKKVAQYAVKKLLRGRTLIFPSFFIWIGRLLAKIVPDQMLAFTCFYAQRRKIQ